MPGWQWSWQSSFRLVAPVVLFWMRCRVVKAAIQAVVRDTVEEYVVLSVSKITSNVLESQKQVYRHIAAWCW